MRAAYAKAMADEALLDEAKKGEVGGRVCLRRGVAKAGGKSESPARRGRAGEEIARVENNSKSDFSNNNMTGGLDVSI